MNIVDSIRQANLSRLDHIAVIEQDRQCSYEELFEAVSKLRNSLASDAKIKKGMRIAFRCEDGIEFIIGSLALLETGAAIVPIDVSLSEDEMAETLERIEVHGFLFQNNTCSENGTEPTLPAAAPPGKGFKWRQITSSQSDQPLDLPSSVSDPAFIRFSSGTTGASKGVVLSHQTIFDRTEAANEGLRIQESDRILWVLQMSHHFAVSILLFLRKGAAIVIAHHDFPNSVLQTAAAGNITFIYAAPFHYQLLAVNNALPPQALQNVRLAISTAMKLPMETARAFADKFGFNLAQAYGIIEIGLPFINLNSTEGSRNSVGRILPAYELYIENPDPEGIGQVLIRGKGMFDAYFSPWQTREEALDQGWFRTGDLGRLDEENSLEIVGREKSVIVCAGMKIFPAEVEQVLNSHHSISDSLVYGVDHSLYGQIPEAKIIVSNSTTEPIKLQKELRRYCYGKLSSYKVPKKFTAVSSLPRTASGKLIRH